MASLKDIQSVTDQELWNNLTVLAKTDDCVSFPCYACPLRLVYINNHRHGVCTGPAHLGERAQAIMDSFSDQERVLWLL